MTDQDGLNLENSWKISASLDTFTLTEELKNKYKDEAQMELFVDSNR
jgi:hypothetical protein